MGCNRDQGNKVRYQYRRYSENVSDSDRNEVNPNVIFLPDQWIDDIEHSREWRRYSNGETSSPPEDDYPE